MFKLIILFLCVSFIISYESAICNIVGNKTDVVNAYSYIFGLVSVYKPYLFANVYFNDTVIIFSYDTLTPLVRMYNDDSAVINTKSDAESWINNYTIGQNYTCFYENTNNVFMAFYTSQQLALWVRIILWTFLGCSCCSLCLCCMCITIFRKQLGCKDCPPNDNYESI